MTARKFDDATEIKICQIFEQEFPLIEDLATRFGCGKSTISGILKRRMISTGSRSSRLEERRQRGTQKPKSEMPVVDKTGQIAGDLTVVKFVGWKYKPSNGSRKAIWEVQCKCGIVKEFNDDAWKKHKIKHDKYLSSLNDPDYDPPNCGDSPVHVKHCNIGDRLSFLEITSIERNQDAQKKGKWAIHAVCLGCNRYSRENPLLISVDNWVKKKKLVGIGGLASCGCRTSVVHGLSVKNTARLNDYALYTMFKSSKRRARLENLPFDLDIDYMQSLDFPRKCPILGIQIQVEQGVRSDNSPSLDKFYPQKGYVKGNVQIISWRANRLKNDGTPDEWFKIAEWCKKEDVRRRLSGEDC